MNKEKTSLSFLIILSAFMAFTSLSTDIYLPAMPSMQADLGGRAELTVTGFVIRFALAQLIFGPISNHIGRKKPLFIGIILFVIGSIGCALSPSMETVVIWRVFQALGACTEPMISRAMIRDRYDSTKAAQMLSTLMKFMIYTMSVTLFYVAVYAFITGSSDIYINYFHIQPRVYSLLFGVNILGVSLMSMVNRRLVTHFNISRLLAISTSLAFIFYVIFAIIDVTHSFGLLGIIIPMFLVFSMNGIVAACANAAALNTVSSDMSGSAAALLGSLHMEAALYRQCFWLYLQIKLRPL